MWIVSGPMKSAEVLGKGHLFTSVSGYDWYNLHLSDGSLRGQYSSSWARNGLEWCCLEEESQGTEFMEGHNSAGRRFTHPF